MEFATPVSPSLVGQLNRNIRKFRILQYRTDQDGMLPMVVGTYGVDLTTGNPIGLLNQPNIPNDNFAFSGSTIGGISQQLGGVLSGESFATSVLKIFKVFFWNGSGNVQNFGLNLGNKTATVLGLWQSLLVPSGTGVTVDFQGLPISAAQAAAQNVELGLVAVGSATGPVDVNIGVYLQ